MSRPVQATRSEAIRNLDADEVRGGHTLARHVARSDNELRTRLATEPIAAASTFTDRETAEWVVTETLARERTKISAWTRREGSRPNLALRYRGSRDRPIGRSVLARRNAAVDCYDAVVVLRWNNRRAEYFVLTSYPETR